MDYKDFSMPKYDKKELDRVYAWPFEEARKIDIFDNENGGKSLCAPDLHHASAPHGQYLLGAVWYEKLTGKSILENPYSVDGISFYELMSLKKAARIAVNSK